MATQEPYDPASTASYELEVDHAAPLEPDSNNDTGSDFDDGDSAIDTLGSSTASIRDELIKEVREHGRQYQGYMEAKYILPMDEQERERIDFQHHIVWLTMDQKLNHAPIKHVNRALDVGCGTGIWAIDFADEHPETEVLGVDLAPVQPHNVPPNLNFEIDDLEQEWTFSRKFNYIHSQMMCGAFTNWQRYINQVFQFLEPNGYFEVNDIDFVVRCDDGTLLPDSALFRWDAYMQEGTKKVGFPLDAIPHIPDMMHRAGFVDIVAIPTKWPINTWPKDKRYKELGKWVNENFIWGAESMCLAVFTRTLGWSIEEVQVFTAAMRNDLRNRKIHAYWNLWIIHGRKPA